MTLSAGARMPQWLVMSGIAMVCAAPALAQPSSGAREGGAGVTAGPAGEAGGPRREAGSAPATQGASAAAGSTSHGAKDSGEREALASLLAEAQAAFDRGNSLLSTDPDGAAAAFAEARDKYAAVVEAGVRNGRLLYNLGNAYVRLGEIGRGIAAYRKAQLLRPGDEQLRANLAFARSLRRDSFETGGAEALTRTLLVWHYRLPARTRVWMAIAAYAALWLLLAARLRWRRPGVSYAAAICLFAWSSLAVSVAVSWQRLDRVAEGVLVASEAEVRKGNGAGYDLQFEEPLHEGVEFAVLEARGGWVHIELPDGNRGWVQREAAELF